MRWRSPPHPIGKAFLGSLAPGKSRHRSTLPSGGGAPTDHILTQPHRWGSSSRHRCSLLDKRMQFVGAAALCGAPPHWERTPGRRGVMPHAYQQCGSCKGHRDGSWHEIEPRSTVPTSQIPTGPQVEQRYWRFVARDFPAINRFDVVAPTSWQVMNACYSHKNRIGTSNVSRSQRSGRYGSCSGYRCWPDAWVCASPGN